MTDNEYGADEVIEAFGGPTKTAQLCEVSKGAVSQWKNNGIPKAQLKFLRASHPGVFEQLAAARHGGVGDGSVHLVAPS